MSDTVINIDDNSEFELLKTDYKGIENVLKCIIKLHEIGVDKKVVNRVLGAIFYTPIIIRNVPKI